MIGGVFYLSLGAGFLFSWRAPLNAMSLEIILLITAAVILSLFLLPFIFYFCGWLLMPFAKLITKLKN